MNRRLSRRQVLTACSAVAGVLMLTTAAAGWAANGMNAPGYGAAQLGLAGAGTAAALNSFATLRNPAAGAWLEDSASFDLGIAVPKGGTDVGPVGQGSQLGLLDVEPGSYTAVTGVFPIPTYARNWRISDRSAFGWGIAASGLKSITEGGSASLARGLPGFDARCEGSFAGGRPLAGTVDLMSLCGNDQTKLGVDLTQVLVSGHYAYRIADSLSLGVAPVFAAQRIMVRGLGAFAAFSNEPGRTTNNGFDFSYGGGVRLGALWEITDGIGIGAAWQSRLRQTEFDRYQGVIIGGSLDFAPTLNVGIQVHPVEGHRLLFDMEKIEYGSIKPLGSQVEPQRFSDQCFIPRLLARSDRPSVLPACLGGSTGPGFGWGDVTIYKLGYQAKLGEMTWRAGFSWGGNPVNKGQTLPTFFAPAISDRHATLGLSWRRPKGAIVDVALVHAIENRVRERNVFSSAQVSVLEGTLVGYRVDSDPQDQEFVSTLGIWEVHVSYSWSP
jgi:long-chain fatty acid transport protein